MIMKIGILGTGDVGQKLGSGFAALGHDVKMGTRDPKSDKVRAWVTKNDPRASAGTFAEAAAFAELAVLATAWSGTENAIRLANPKNFTGKIVIDTTNPLIFRENAPPALALGHTDSAGEQVQRWLTEARVVKAFNIVGNAHMVDPQFPGGPPDMLICGNDRAAKAKATEICAAFGWPVIDMGGIEGARLLEPLALIWILYGVRSGTWNHAWKLLRK
jgi:predicted dinucleotide-binding enzyme